MNKLNLKLKGLFPLFLVFIMVGSLLSPMQIVAAGNDGSTELLNELTDETVESTTEVPSESDDTAISTDEKVKQSIHKTKEYYYGNLPDFSKSSSHSDYWFFSALWGADTDLKNDVPWKENGSPWESSSYWSKGIDNKNGTSNEDAGAIIGSILLGKDPHQFGKRDVVQDLIDKQKENGSFFTIWGEPWAMIALDLMEADYNREKHIEFLLSQQKNGTFGGVDSNGWVLTALAPYMNDRQDVKTAIELSVETVNKGFKEKGEISDGWGANANSIAAALMGLAAVGEDLYSEKWSKDGENVVEQFIETYQQDDGSFWWQKNMAGAIGMATEQALLALATVDKKESIFVGLKEYRKNVLDRTTTVTMRIEGINDTLYPEQTMTIKTFNKDATAFEATTQALDEAGVSYDAYGDYIASINDEEQATFGTWDGWQYMVNSEYPNVGAGDYVLKDGDTIVWFYGNVGDIYEGYIEDVEDLTLRPTVTIAPQLIENEDILITVESTYNVIDEYFDVKEENVKTKIKNADVTFNGETFKTDENGIVRIPGEKAKVGSYEIKVTKDIEGSYPRLLRQSKKIIIEEEPSLPPPSEDVVTLSVEKRSIGQGDIITPLSIMLQSGDTAFTLLKRLVDEKGISIEYTGSGAELYVKSIDGLGEFDNGPLSGWMYSVNGTFPDYSAGNYTLKNGDVIRWQYTTDLGKDLGSSYAPGPVVIPETPKKEDTVTRKSIEEAVKWINKNRDFTIYDDFNDWDVLALARSNNNVSESYYTSLIDYVKENKGEFRKVTDYERIALAVTAIGKDPKNIAGYNFIEKIYSNARMTSQGVNGVVFALLALDAKKYEIPADALWTREKLLNWLLEQQKEDGGFPLASGASSDIDITAMALQALANYQDKKEVKLATDKALNWLSRQQQATGGFESAGTVNSESISQVIIALTSLGIDLDDKRFTKDKGDLRTALQSFINKDGGISHTIGDESNYLATQQGLLALIAIDRFNEGKKGLYVMTDVAISKPTVSFKDVALNSFGQEEIHKLVEAEIIKGYPNGMFKPGEAVTRGQSAILLMRALNLDIPKTMVPFKDVPKSSAFYEAAQATKAANIFKGDGTGTVFGGSDVLTRQQMASILVRAFNLKGTDAVVNLNDLNLVSDAHRSDVEILFQNGITVGTNDGAFKPGSSVTRAEFAVFLHRAMNNAKK
ncbi:DUF4430 domain-containing protein [Sporosarcina sp. FSL W8-0480]|uniref:DUF4430 domain-containing protein n=1 Tax=Sporosarcina sp. FSL W8-0480 TaxID=2954701 RepID=UPI0030DC3845